MQTDHFSGVLLSAFGFKHIKYKRLWMYKSSWKCHGCNQRDPASMEIHSPFPKYAESLRVHPRVATGPVFVLQVFLRETVFSLDSSL